MKNIIKIGNRKIGEKFKPFIICELGINHNGSLKLAKKIKPTNIKSSIYDVIEKNVPSQQTHNHQSRSRN